MNTYLSKNEQNYFEISIFHSPKETCSHRHLAVCARIRKLSSEILFYDFLFINSLSMKIRDDFYNVEKTSL